MQYATEGYNQNEQKKWTYDSIGLETENAKNNLEYIGDQESQTTRATGLITTQKHTTEIQDKNS